jgi:colanic acid/amylovoran biosynthesis glycosyltransferase
MMPKKITFCAYDKPDSIGGPVTWLMHLLPYLKQTGFEVSCFILFHKGNNGPLYEHLVKNDITVHTSSFLSSTEDNIKWILDCLQKNTPHLFVPNIVVPAYYACKWAKKAGVTTIGISHSDDPFYHAIQKEFIGGHKSFRLDGMICVSKVLEQQLLKSKYASKVKIKRIPYGVIIPDSKATRDDTSLRVIYVGRLAEQQKRISEVTRSFCEMTQKINGVEAIIYGDGPDKINVENILNEQQINTTVSLGGNIHPKQMTDKLLKAHVIVLLSDYEGLPISILEAMACGVVPVCLNMRSGITELIENGKTGCIVDDRYVHFIETIKELKADNLLREQMSLNAKQLVKENFSLEISCNSYSSFFNDFKIKRIQDITIPTRFKLPKINQDLSRADTRRPKFNFNQLKISLGRYKHKLFSN